jgi:hypothetical protein
MTIRTSVDAVVGATVVVFSKRPVSILYHPPRAAHAAHAIAAAAAGVGNGAAYAVGGGFAYHRGIHRETFLHDAIGVALGLGLGYGYLPDERTAC